jgi:hypothetical protein
MKKFFSVSLAVLMTLALASAALAATPSVDLLVADVLNVPLVVDDSMIDSLASSLYPSGVPYGTTVYYPLIGVESDSGGGTADYVFEDNFYYNPTYWITDSDSVRSATIKKDWEMGEEYVESMTVVKKKADISSDSDIRDFLEHTHAIDSGDPDYTGYYYFLAVELSDSSRTTATGDVIGTLTLKKTGSNGFVYQGEYGENEIDFELSLTIGFPYSEDYFIDENTKIFNFSESGTSPLGGSEEDQLDLFGSTGYFLIHTEGQGKVAISCKTDYIASIANDYPQANLDFITCNGATFNRTGTLYLYADEDTYLYEVNADGDLKEVRNADYDSYEEAFVLNTRKLGSYVISDMELDGSSSNDNDDDIDDDITEVVISSSSSSGGPSYVPINPATGACA